MPRGLTKTSKRSPGQMGGARPGAGRKPYSEEVKRIHDINKCWDVVMEFVTSDAPLKERCEIATKIAVKAVPDKIEWSGKNGKPMGIVLINPEGTKIDLSGNQT